MSAPGLCSTVSEVELFGTVGAGDDGSVVRDNKINVKGGFDLRIILAPERLSRPLTGEFVHIDNLAAMPDFRRSESQQCFHMAVTDTALFGTHIRMPGKRNCGKNADALRPGHGVFSSVVLGGSG